MWAFAFSASAAFWRKPLKNASHGPLLYYEMAGGWCIFFIPLPVLGEICLTLPLRSAPGASRVAFDKSEGHPRASSALRVCHPPELGAHGIEQLRGLWNIRCNWSRGNAALTWIVEIAGNEQAGKWKNYSQTVQSFAGPLAYGRN